jgi:hypothetical protein
MGFVPEKIPHIKMAARAGSGRLEPDRLSLPSGIDLGDIIGRPAKYIGRQQRFLCWAGLRIQGAGQGLAKFGHLLHLAPSFSFVASRGFRKVYRTVFRGGRKPDLGQAAAGEPGAD